MYVLLGLTADLKSLITFTILSIIFDNLLCFKNRIAEKSYLKVEKFTLSLTFDNAALLTLSILTTLQKLILSKLNLVFDKPNTKRTVSEKFIFLFLLFYIVF